MSAMNEPSLARRLCCGAAMGVADAVPGVSGGTIALIMGVYGALIRHLHLGMAVLRAPRQAESWRNLGRSLLFLAPLLCCLAVFLIMTTRLLVGSPPTVAGLSIAEADQLLADEAGWLLRRESAPLVYALFFGLVAASIPLPLARRRQQHWGHLLPFAGGAALAALVVLLPPSAGSIHPLALLIAGALAISVMLLPGISGSLLLLILGMYHPISEALNRLDLSILIWVMLGVGAGVLLIVPAIKSLLERAHDGTMACLAGLMMGSLLALWPWKSHYVPKQINEWGPMALQAPSGAWWWPLLAMLLGTLIILIVRGFEPRQESEVG